MKGDFSRIRFNPAKQYTSVLEQQGRVSLDADSNEQSSIYDYMSKNETIDVIGPMVRRNMMLASQSLPRRMRFS